MLNARHPRGIDELARALATVRAEAMSCSDADAASIVCEALRAADALTATALELIATRGGLEAATGLSTESVLRLDGRQTYREARALTQSAATLRVMPGVARAFADGALSYSQVRAISAEVAHVDAAGRETIDDLVAGFSLALRSADPEELLWRVADAAAAARPDLALAREDRAIERNTLRLQPRLYGGGTIYGEADTERFATIAGALDAAAAAPVDPEAPAAPTRAQQHMDAFVAICEAYVSGGTGGSTRPRPRVLATIDAEALGAGSEGARVLHALAGWPARLTRLSTEVLVCDAEVQAVIFDGARPVAVGDAHAPVTSKMRAALVARDQGCRFPGCGAPATWADAHHVLSRFDGGPTAVDNLVLLCRRHHRTVHRHRWRVKQQRDGTFTFTRRGVTYTTPPPRSARIPARE